MNLVPIAVSNEFVKRTLLFQRHSPRLLFVGGVVGVTASTVLACRATLRVEDVLQEARERRMLIESTLDDATAAYFAEDHNRDLGIIQRQTAIRLIRLYGPAVIVGALSITALAKSHSILSQRNSALAAAYTALEKGFDQYRARVIDKFGEEQDRDFRYGTGKLQVIDPETKKKKTIRQAGEASIYAKFFDETCPSWRPDADMNRAFLLAQQGYANTRLHARGHLLLNDVYQALGMNETQAGCVVGWILSKDGSTDNFVDFGIFDRDSDRARAFVNDFEDRILLDFNVDGPIWSRLEEV